VDEDHLALYLIDVTGHGLDAALLSVTVANVIRAGALPGADMKQPDQVLAKLNDAFQGEQHGERYFTIWYGVYQCASRTMTWAGGGHPPEILSDHPSDARRIGQIRQWATQAVAANTAWKQGRVAPAARP
jgi:sigma-B regulation protein RsbU (phosphoserine phosphatase)